MIEPNKYSFFKADDPVFDEGRRKPRNGKLPDVLPRSIHFNSRLTNINYLKGLLSSSNSNLQLQPVIKIISKADHIRGVKAAVNYIARFAGLKAEQEKGHEQVVLYDQDGKIIKSQEEVTQIVKQWQQDTKKGRNIMTHMIFSPGGNEERNKQKSLAATKQFLEQNLKARGFDYFLAPHFDTKNHHFHVIVKQTSKLSKNFRLDKHDLFVARDLYAQNLTNYGVKRSSAARLDKKEVLEKIISKIENLKEQNTVYQAKLADKSSKDFNAYGYKARLAGKIEKIASEIKYNQEKNKDMNLLDKLKLEKDYQELKKFKKEIIKQTKKEDIKTVISKTISFFEKDNQLLAGKIDETLNQDNQTKFAYLKPKQPGKYLTLIIQNQVKEINQAKEQLKQDLKLNSVNFDLEKQQLIKQSLIHFDSLTNQARKLELGIERSL